MSTAIDMNWCTISYMAQGDIGKRIRIARETLSNGLMRSVDLARKLDVSRARLSAWETGRSDPPPDLAQRAAELLGVSFKFLMTGEADAKPEVSKPLYPVSYEPIAIPYGGLVPCGDWQDPIDTEELVELEAKFSGNGRFATRIEGASMMPVLQPDDIAVFQSYGNRAPKLRHIVLARNPENAVTVKELQYENGGFTLKSINHQYDDAKADSWQAIAYLVGIVRERGSYVRSEYNPDGLTLSDVIQNTF